MKNKPNRRHFSSLNAVPSNLSTPLNKNKMSFIKSSPNPKEYSTPLSPVNKPSKETTNLLNKINLIKNMVKDNIISNPINGNSNKTLENYQITNSIYDLDLSVKSKLQINSEEKIYTYKNYLNTCIQVLSNLSDIYNFKHTDSSNYSESDKESIIEKNTSSKINKTIILVNCCSLERKASCDSYLISVDESVKARIPNQSDFKVKHPGVNTIDSFIITTDNIILNKSKDNINQINNIELDDLKVIKDM